MERTVEEIRSAHIAASAATDKRNWFAEVGILLVEIDRLSAPLTGEMTPFGHAYEFTDQMSGGPVWIFNHPSSWNAQTPKRSMALYSEDVVSAALRLARAEVEAMRT